ncbi:prepilin-type N-terminal cleavage/methylation domain-containing protein [Puniceicoccus vermicola]|uniref:Prepilin-type N-terminal cleavage/methylation domain-containing protein n=1 Tax=Puniceicoccus vermicola TaxID=388746 RepID=A0A7X1B4E3_9BACT|nr:prepilin-type N-terminal cleavage/methylation domain-containing protein [Puniceicoccus vermicola]MBC2604185.1 prepilin-type N-terminal cleavage/methylation domain-containing protein [Puniceicoccus vermicola]
MAFPQKSSRSAFTLVELLVVLGVMALFVGVFATALRPGSPTVAVEGAQSQLASLLTQARGVAVLKNASTRLIIHNDSAGDDDRYLRFAGIVYAVDTSVPADGKIDEWWPATDGITLPQGVYARIDDWGNMETGFNLEYISDTTEEYAYIEFYTNGTVANVSGGPIGSPILAVSTGEPNPNATGGFDDPTFNDDNVRGAIVRRYGSFVLLNEPNAFPTEVRP